MDYLDYEAAVADSQVLRRWAIPCRIHGEDGKWWIKADPPWHENMSDADARVEAAAGWDDRDKQAADYFNRRRREGDYGPS